MQCPKCGKQVDLSDAFCRGCGHALGSNPLATKEWKAGPIRIKTTIVSTTTGKIPPDALACSNCGGQIDLTEGKCKSCGKPLELTGSILEAVQKATSGLPVKTFTAGAQLKIDLSKLAGIFAVVGLLIFLAASVYVRGGQHAPRQIPSLHGPWSPLHFVAFFFLGLALLLLLADKFRD